MSAIRNGQFQLKPVKEATQQATAAAGARDALFSALKNGHFTLKPVNPATVPEAGKHTWAHPCSSSTRLTRCACCIRGGCM